MRRCFRIESTFSEVSLTKLGPILGLSPTQGTKFRQMSAKYRRFFVYRWRPTRYPPPIVDLMKFREFFGEIGDFSGFYRFFGDFADFSDFFFEEKNPKILQPPGFEPGPKQLKVPPFSTRPTSFSLDKVQIKVICSSIVHIIFTLLI